MLSSVNGLANSLSTFVEIQLPIDLFLESQLHFLHLHSCVFLKIDFRERGKEREREGQREKHRFVVPLIYAFIR